MTVAELLEHGLSSAALADGCWSLPQAFTTEALAG